MYGEESPDGNKPILLEVRVFWVIIATFVVVGVLAILLHDKPNKWVYLQTVILALTLIVVAWYTYLTRKMQEAIVRQTNVTILPIIGVTLVIEGDLNPHMGGQARSRRSFIVLENIGQGTALNITIDDMFIKDAMNSAISLFEGEPIWFGSISSLVPTQKSEIREIQLFDKSEVHLVNETRPDILKYLSPENTKRDYELIIRFTDMLGNKYAQVCTVGRSGFLTGAIKPSEKVKKLTINYK